MTRNGGPLSRIGFRRALPALPAPADAGSAAVWVLSCSVLLLMVGLAVVLRTSAVLARHKAQGAADLAALAAAGRIGISGAMCDVASGIARANGAELVRCSARLDAGARSGIVDVEVRVHVVLGPVGGVDSSATARAGRDPPARRDDN